ncbi:aminotransferase class I and II [Xylogone sp. PMI_703]|nr:aminotransferase class I and II [Xylogone sp. PMI_703]
MEESGHLAEQMRSTLDKRAANSAFRKLTIASPGSVDFSSNDFLSLSTSPALKQAFLQQLSSVEPFRLGSGGSRLLDGNNSHAEQLEKDLAAFFHAPAGLLFNSGFDANSGFFACVPQPGDVVLYDEHIHASVHEGMRLSRAGVRLQFQHNSVIDLERQLERQVENDALIREGTRNVFIAVESLYSMDGDIAPIKEIVELVEKVLPNRNGHIIVDEAHSTGIYGLQGRGVVCSLGLEDRVFARLHTFGKALACNGAVFLCSSLTRSYLINYARPLIYTTFMSLPSVVAIQTVLSFLREGGSIKVPKHLWRLIAHLYRKLESLEIPNPEVGSRSDRILRIPSQCPQSPIFSLLTSMPRSLAKACQDAGFVVRPIVPPTVPEGSQRVRVCLHAGNSFEDINNLVATIAEWIQQSKNSNERNDIVATGGIKPRL